MCVCGKVMRERVLTHPHSHKRCCCLRGVFAPLFGAVLMELPRGCKHNYTCTESDWGHNLDPGDKCTRCRSIYVIDAIEGLANASELLFSEPHNASSSFLLHVAACCCMLLRSNACQRILAAPFAHTHTSSLFECSFVAFAFPPPLILHVPLAPSLSR